MENLHKCRDAFEAVSLMNCMEIRHGKINAGMSKRMPKSVEREASHVFYGFLALLTLALLAALVILFFVRH